MNKDFIPYEEALALKELGFDETCFKSYQRGKYRPCVSSDLELMDVAYDDFIDLCHAPLYQQAFRWFREEHNLSHAIVEHEKKYSYSTNCGDFKIIGSYEETELACLKTLIKILKNE